MDIGKWQSLESGQVIKVKVKDWISNRQMLQQNPGAFKIMENVYNVEVGPFQIGQTPRYFNLTGDNGKTYVFRVDSFDQGPIGPTDDIKIASFNTQFELVSLTRGGRKSKKAIRKIRKTRRKSKRNRH